MATDLLHRKRDPVSRVTTLELKKTILEHAERRNDEWGETVKGRLVYCNDLVAEEAIYHNACMPNSKYNNKTERKTGRPDDDSRRNVFESICQWLEEEGDSELYTMKELITKFEDMGSTGYTPRYLKQLLKERYGEHIYFSELPGRSDVVCFKEFAN